MTDRKKMWETYTSGQPGNRYMPSVCLSVCRSVQRLFGRSVCQFVSRLVCTIRSGKRVRPCACLCAHGCRCTLMRAGRWLGGWVGSQASGRAGGRAGVHVYVCKRIFIAGLAQRTLKLRILAGWSCSQTVMLSSNAQASRCDKASQIAQLLFVFQPPSQPTAQEVASDDFGGVQVRWSTVTTGKAKAPYHLTLEVQVRFCIAHKHSQ